jgi:hypothetical protein
VGLIACLLAFAGTLALSRRGPAHALGFVLLIGSVYGLLRARIYDGYSHFIFDASLLALYLAAIRSLNRRPEFRALLPWTGLLVATPVAVILVSPFLDAQPLVVQFLGLRNILLFVPALLIGACLSREEWLVLAGWSSLVVLVATAFALGEVSLGLESFFPHNEVTELIYRSGDVGDGRDGALYRIPAAFTSAHAYAGTMIALLPVLALQWMEVKQWRWLTLLVIGLACAGVFLSGARTPVVLLVGMLGAAALASRREPRTLLLVAALVPLVVFVVGTSERFRRFETLGDTEFVEQRFHQSVNLSLLDTALEYPFGRGLGSAVGTSIPYFVDDEARLQMGLENEYARLALELGVPGLVLWIAFLLRTLAIDPLRCQRLGGLPDCLMWGFGVLSWFAAGTGLGLLASVPSTLLLFLQMGALAAQQRIATDDQAVRISGWART